MHLYLVENDSRQEVACDKYDVNEDKVTLPEAMDYLDQFRALGSLPPKAIKEHHKKKKKDLKIRY